MDTERIGAPSRLRNGAGPERLRFLTGPPCTRDNRNMAVLPFTAARVPAWITSLEGGGASEHLLDGQQRITSLYGVIKGEIPDFFHGDEMSFSNLYFHAGEERLHIEQIAGEGHSVDTVVDISNRLNSAGTKLSSDDLALARIAAKCPDAWGEMRSRLKAWRIQGFSFTVDWLPRCVNAVATAEASSRHLHDAPRE